MKRAVLVKDLSSQEWQGPTWRGEARLYKLDPPMENEGDLHEYVVVSAVNAFSGTPQTFIFASDDDGKVDNWFQLEGSFTGSLDHEKALAIAGYDVVEEF